MICFAQDFRNGDQCNDRSIRARPLLSNQDNSDALLDKKMAVEIIVLI